jgi:hypothetical protein
MKLNFGNGNNKCAFIGVSVIAFLIIAALIAVYFNKKKCKCETSPKKETFVNSKVSNRYNALYTSPDKRDAGYFKYTHPPGDVNAQKYAGTGQGTSGSFFPLQGHGSQIMMAHSYSDNKAGSSNHPGKIGGGPNYTQKHFTSWINGFNDFGSPFSNMETPATTDDHYSNSYLVNGNNVRVENAGQKGDLKCGDSWPHLEKNGSGFCTTANDAMVNCEPSGQQANSIQSCSGGNRFVISKMKPNWKKV